MKKKEPKTVEGTIVDTEDYYKPTIGRPTIFKEEYIESLEKYFNQPPYKEVTEDVVDKYGRTVAIKRKVANDPPYLNSWAQQEGLAIRTVFRWIDKKDPGHKPAFRQCYEEVVKSARERYLAVNGLLGLVAQPMSIFLMKAWLGMRDTTFIDHSSKDGSMKPEVRYLLAIPPEAPPPADD